MPGGFRSARKIDLTYNNMPSTSDEHDGVSASAQDRLDASGGSHDVARLIVGGALLGSNILMDWLRGGSSPPQKVETEQPSGEDALEDEDAIRLRHAALGLTFRTVEAARIGASAVLGAASQALKPVKAVIRSPAPVSAAGPLDRLIERGRAELEGLVQYGAEEEQRSKALTEKTFNQAVVGITDYFGDNPQIQGLIRSQVDLLSKEVEQVPQLDILVRVLVNNYIEYLNENPQMVEELLTEQSLSLGGEVLEMVRFYAVTVDSVLEMILRRILRRADRSEIPEPPPQVMARAVYTSPFGNPITRQRSQQ
jgi:hypothetical protein